MDFGSAEYEQIQRRVKRMCVRRLPPSDFEDITGLVATDCWRFQTIDQAFIIHSARWHISHARQKLGSVGRAYRWDGVTQILDGEFLDPAPEPWPAVVDIASLPESIRRIAEKILAGTKLTTQDRQTLFRYRKAWRAGKLPKPQIVTARDLAVCLE